MTHKSNYCVLLLCMLISLQFVLMSYAATLPTAPVPPSISSQAALLVDADTQTILWQKNAFSKNYPASTTKLMTALLTIEQGKLTDTFVVSQDDLNLREDYASYFLLPNEKFTVRQLLNDLLIISDNGAANTLARYVDGSLPKFVEHMNNRAQELGCRQTHFANAYGFHEEQHYTTCYDLYLIARAVMQHYTLYKIVNTCAYTLPATNIYPREDRLLENTNLLLWDDEPYYDKRCRGIKTGYTTPAGRCLVAMASLNKKRLYVVILGGKKIKGVDERFADARKLFDYGYQLLSHVK